MRGLSLLVLFSGAAHASCQFGAPVVSALGQYDYVHSWTQTVQLPVTCTDGSVVTRVQLSTADGSLEAGTGRFLGTMRFGAAPLKYMIPGASQLQVINNLLTLPVTVPAGQWGAPTGSYSDNLTVNIEF